VDPAADHPEDETTLTSVDDVALLLRKPDSLRIVFQPVVDLRTGSVAGYEALTRVANWPARSPELWFSAADRAGLAPQLEAVALAAALRARPDLRAGQFLTVNLSGGVLSHPLVAEVLAAQQTLEGLVADLSELSRMVAADLDALAALRARGLMIAATVTQAGLGELAEIGRVGPDLLALGRDLVAGVHADPLRARLVRSVVEVGRESGAGVLAQGLEALEDVRFLQLAGVRLGQGWLLGRARPVLLPAPDEAADLIRACWEEALTVTRVGRLALPVPSVGQAQGSDWAARVDREGHLESLVRRDGTTVRAVDVLRLRASQDLRAAAARLLSAGPGRRPHGLVAVVDDEGRFVGLVDADALLREALTDPAG
jgi:EAL domain-containing protein (putative c-di-GMP-specific phosphodiesterase class I)